MRLFLFTLSLIIFSIPVYSQTLCGTANENGTVVLTAPVGSVFISVTFASYGTPNGSCGSYTISGCHASSSMSVVQAALIGNNSASIPATNGNFGDPCVGTVKRLYVQAVYGIVTPLELISFSGKIKDNKNLLQWETVNEQNTKQFNIERSENGMQFSTIGTIDAKNNSEKNLYSYTDNSFLDCTFFYRLKMIDRDGKYVYSRIVKISDHPGKTLVVFPNPTTDYITLSNMQDNGLIEIMDMQGKMLQQMNITVQAKVINMSGYQNGIYIVRYTNDKEIVYQKIIKQ